jgi:hypothetical protein
MVILVSVGLIRGILIVTSDGWRCCSGNFYILCNDIGGYLYYILIYYFLYFCYKKICNDNLIYNNNFLII